RRRHTSFSRDWSSNVCSSDLSPEEREELGEHAARLRRRRGPVAAVTIAVVAVSAWQMWGAASWRDAFDLVTLAWWVLLVLAWIRSEERRVGRGWRRRGWRRCD